MIKSRRKQKHDCLMIKVLRLCHHLLECLSNPESNVEINTNNIKFDVDSFSAIKISNADI